jgi:ribosomal protein S10
MKNLLLKLVNKADNKMQRFMSRFYDGWNDAVYEVKRKVEDPQKITKISAVSLPEVDKVMREMWASELHKQIDRPSVLLQMLERE